MDELKLWVNGKIQLPKEVKNPKVKVFFSEDVVGRDIGAAGKFALCYELRIVIRIACVQIAPKKCFGVGSSYFVL